MAHFDTIKPGGIWSLFALLSSQMMGIFDRTLAKAINGDEGGTWTPQNPTVGGSVCPIRIGGDGLEVPGPFLATDAKIVITSGKFLTINSGGTFGANLGSFTNLRGTVILENTFTLKVNGPRAGKIILEAATYLEVKSGATVDIAGTLNVSTLMNLGEGSITNLAGTLFAEAGSFITVGVDAKLNLLGDLNVKNHGVMLVEVGGILMVDGAFVANKDFTLGQNSVGTWHGTHVLKSGLTITSQIGIDITFAGLKLTGPLERKSVGSYDKWRELKLAPPVVLHQTYVIGHPENYDRWVIPALGGLGGVIVLGVADVPDDVRTTFWRGANADLSFAEIRTEGGDVLFKFLAPGVSYPTSCTVYKSDGLWVVESWSGVKGTSIEFFG